MKNITWRLLIAAAAAVVTLHCNAETLDQYFKVCQSKLGFTEDEYNASSGTVTATTALSKLNCYDGDLFAPSTGPDDPTSDYVGYARINDKVDSVFACRWLKGIKSNGQKAASIEMIIHNRQNGETCFFDAKLLDANIVPLNKAGTFPQAFDWWKSPDEIAASNKICVNCHSSGPYIASQRIAQSLQGYGLLNDGHDTTQNDGRLISQIRYGVVGSAFFSWNAIALQNVGLPGTRNNIPFNTSTCADACHSLNVNNTPDITKFFSGTQRVLIPSINQVQANIGANGLMPPAPSSAYRWVNMDTPATDGGEYETLANLRQQYPKFACAPATASMPAVVDLTAHVVGNYEPDTRFHVLAIQNLPDKLRAFNARDGVICNNSDQVDGHACHRYVVRYFCNDIKTWTTWTSAIDPNTGAVGGHSQTPACSSGQPSAIQLSVNPGDGNGAMMATGPADRLAKFDNDGLICRNSDQGPGNTCSNYVVQFQCRTTQPPPTPIVAIRGVTLQARLREDTDFVITDPSPINGWTISSAIGRQIIVNGVPVSSGQLPLPERTMDGKYHFTITGTTISNAPNVTWSYW